MTTTVQHIKSKRQQFASPGSKHDRNIRLLRVLLPLGVGALGAILALAPFTTGGELSFVLDKDSVDVAGERMRVTEADGVLNDQDNIVVMVDEAHRTQSSELGENIFEAFPNAARIAFTGTPLLALHVHRDGQPPRLGLAVSRKVDRRAVGRNRIKRALREEFRALRARLPDAAYVVVARAAAKTASRAELRAAFHDALRRAGALPTPGLTVTMPASPVPDTTPRSSGE